MKKLTKWIGIIVSIPFVLLLILALSLYIPPIQQWMLKQATYYAAEKMGMDVTIGCVRLAFPLDVSMEKVLIVRQNDTLPQVKDTIASAQRMVANVQLLPLLDKRVEINEFRFEQLQLHTANLIASAQIKGSIGSLSLVSHGVYIKGSTARVNRASLKDAKLQILLTDSADKDTTQSNLLWKIQVDSLAIHRSDVTIRMPGDTLQLRAYMGKAIATHGYFDLAKRIYKVKQLDWNNGEMNYDNRWKAATKGLDYNHLALKDINVCIAAVVYQEPKLDVSIRQMAFKEKSGFELKNLSGAIALDTTKLYINGLRLNTTESHLMLNTVMDLNSFEQKNPGSFNTLIHLSLGRNDLLRFIQHAPKYLYTKLPNAPLIIDGQLNGNMQHMSVKNMHILLPSALDVRLAGYAANLNNLKHLKANINVKAKTRKLDFVKAFMSKDTRKAVTIPSNIALNAHIKVNGTQYASTFNMQQGGGMLSGNVLLNTKGNMQYHARVRAQGLPLHHFLPQRGLHPFTGDMVLNGKGTDFRSLHTALDAKINIANFKYNHYDLSRTTVKVSAKNGYTNAVIYSNNHLIKGEVQLSAVTNTKHIKAKVETHLQHLDLHGLKLIPDTMTIALHSRLNIATNLQDMYQVEGNINGLTINNQRSIYHSAPINIALLTQKDLTDVKLNTGDFYLNLQSGYGYQHLLNRSEKLVAELNKQLAATFISEPKLRALLPHVNIHLQMGKDNLIVNLINNYGICLDKAMLNMQSFPNNGLEAQLTVDKLLVDSVQLDKVEVLLSAAEEGTTYSLHVQNNPSNPQYVFDAYAAGFLNEKGTNMRTKLYDEKGKLNVALGLSAQLEKKGIRIQLDTIPQVIGYKNFAVNNDNYIFVGNDKRISAQVSLRSNDGAGIQITSNDQHIDILQDVTLSVHQIDLENILRAIPYVPNIAGTLNGDFHFVQTKEHLSVSSSIGVQKLSYENNLMGNISTEFVYMPKADGAHFIDAVLYSQNKQIATVTGVYGKQGDLQAKLNLQRIPLQMLNGFIPHRIIGLKGYADGEMSVTGTPSKPNLTGEVYLDSSYIFSEPYGVEMRFANDPVKIENSKVKFENFEMFANNDSPLNVYGTFDFSNLSKMYLNIKMRTENFEIIDARENIRSEAYGKAFVDFLGSIKGNLDNLKMRGKLNVLGTTDITYILKDNELTTDNQLEELVKFTNFNDSTKPKVKRPQLMGFDMDINMLIDEAAHIVCMLNADHTNFIDLLGGGTLRMRYNTTDNLKLVGRYTLNSGEMKYALPIIPLKTFHIKNGSYIEFLGNPMNPKLHITATEPIKTTVNEGTGAGRIVDFDCGVKLSQTLEKPGIEFIINAPNDMNIQDQLNTMTQEGRGKVAITMLVSGMYLTDGNMAAFSMNSALSSYLQNEINNITGAAMRSMGLDLGMSIDNTTTATGGMHTDYNFRFSKRLWNNRLRVIVGGKVSSGEEIMANKDNSFFDKVEIEYRLNKNASQYLRLFYNNNTYDWLDGLIGEYGMGFTWRRKLSHFKNIFLLKNEQQQLQPIQILKNDSTKNDIQIEN